MAKRPTIGYHLQRVAACAGLATDRSLYCRNRFKEKKSSRMVCFETTVGVVLRLFCKDYGRRSCGGVVGRLLV